MKEVTIGGKTYSLVALKIKESRAWRKQFEEKLSSVMQTISTAPTVSLTSPTELGDLINAVKQFIFTAPDLLLDMVCAYSKEIEADRQIIEENATDEEVAEVLGVILRIVFPLGKLMGNGQPTKPTLKN